MISAFDASRVSSTSNPRSFAAVSMCGATPSSFAPIFTMVPVAGTSAWNTLVQFGLAKIASPRSSPTLRESTSNAATKSMSPTLYPPISSWIRPAPVLLPA